MLAIWTRVFVIHSISNGVGVGYRDSGTRLSIAGWRGSSQLVEVRERVSQRVVIASENSLPRSFTAEQQESPP